MTDELKPVRCGCGGEAEVYIKMLSGNLPNIYILCRNCSIRTEEYYTEAEAITAWNKAMGRAKVDVLPNTIEDKGEMPFCPHCGDELEWE